MSGRFLVEFHKFKPGSLWKTTDLKISIDHPMGGKFECIILYGLSQWVDLRSLPTGLKIAVVLMAQSCLDA